MATPGEAFPALEEGHHTSILSHISHIGPLSGVSIVAILRYISRSKSVKYKDKYFQRSFLLNRCRSEYKLRDKRKIL